MVFIISYNAEIIGYVDKFNDVQNYINEVVNIFDESFDITVVHGNSQVEIYEQSNWWFFSSLFSQKRLCNIVYQEIEKIEFKNSQENSENSEQEKIKQN